MNRYQIGVAFALLPLVFGGIIFLKGEDPSRALIRKLAILRGTFEIPQKGLPYIEGDSLPPIDDDLAQKFVPALVDCMGSREPVQVEFKNKKITLGVMCWYTLRTMTYFECSDMEGDVVECEDAPAEFDPGATDSEVEGVQKAWQNELARAVKRYFLS